MLEKITFNCKTFRYRTETEERILVYNVRSAAMMFVEGSAKKVFEDMLNGMNLDAACKSRYWNFFVEQGVFVWEPDGR